MDDEHRELLAECLADAADIIETYNEAADTGQRITHKMNAIPHFASLLFQARTQAVDFEGEPGPSYG